MARHFSQAASFTLNFTCRSVNTLVNLHCTFSPEISESLLTLLLLEETKQQGPGLGRGA